VEFHYTWEFARHFGPLLGWLHRSGFFNAYIFLPVMTLPAMALYIWVFIRLKRNNSIRTTIKTLRFLWQFFYFYICWMAMNSLAVGFKTMIVEELVYQERKWFEPYLPGIHFYITSACLAYIALIVRSRPHYYDLLLAIYLQVALVVGIIVAGYRALNEDIEGAIGGVILLIFFVVCNYDLIMRSRGEFSPRVLVPKKAAA
jgi:hypothetical protein